MTDRPFSDMQFENLPRYAREYIKDLEQQRDTAVFRYEELFDSQEVSPITFESALDAFQNPKFLMPYMPRESSRDYSRTRFWMNGSRWGRDAQIRDFFEITRGKTNSSRFTEKQYQESLDHCLTVKAGENASMVVEPENHSEVVLRFIPHF